MCIYIGYILQREICSMTVRFHEHEHSSGKLIDNFQLPDECLCTKNRAVIQHISPCGILAAAAVLIG